MKRNFLRFCLMLGLISFNSCRQDILPEHETYSNSGAFQLTSKRISLSEAKHKAKLFPEVEKVETGITGYSKSNAQAKTVNYGNGVSIDTDDVIYLEKGPDYYTYTFRINRENAPANAPIENLVLSPLPDGTWKEVLVTYYLTAQERDNMLSGVAVDFTGKVTHEALQNGTYSSAMIQQDVMNCYLEVNSYYTRCGESDDHHNGEKTGKEGPCRSKTPSVLVVSLVRKCTMALPVDTSLGENGEGGGSGPQNGPGGLGGNPHEETVTAPNLPLPPKTPCVKIKNSMNIAKEISSNSIIKSQNDIMKAGIATDINEKGFSFGFDSNGNYKTSPIVEIGSVGGELPLSNLGFTPTGTSHNHNGTNRPPCPSPTDIYSLNTVNQTIPTFEYNFINGTDGSQFVVSIIDNISFNNFVQDYPMNTNVNVFHAQNNPNGNNFWIENSKIYKDFYNAAKYFAGQGESTFDAQAYGMVFVAQKYKMGIIMGKKDSNGNFRPMQISTKRNKDDFSKLEYELQYLCGL